MHKAVSHGCFKYPQLITGATLLTFYTADELADCGLCNQNEIRSSKSRNYWMFHAYFKIQHHNDVFLHLGQPFHEQINIEV